MEENAFLERDFLVSLVDLIVSFVSHEVPLNALLPIVSTLEPTVILLMKTEPT